MVFLWGRFRLDFTSKTTIMGVLNVTPDSFSDGGFYLDAGAARDRAFQMASEGAGIIDIGGLSTRPGSVPVSVEEELRRIIPVIEAVAPHLDIPISVDTYRAPVARLALDAGAAMINDISGLRFDPEMAGLAASRSVPVVVMHIRGTPRDMQDNVIYEALVPEVLDYLRQSIAIAEAAGIDKIIVDPGIGFGKTFDHNLEIIDRIGEFTALGRPVLAGPSRKAFIGAIVGGAPSGRLFGTSAAVAALALGGCHIIRVHDVMEMVQVVRVTDAIRRRRAAVEDS